MATPETPDSSSSSNLQTQIGELTDQLIQLSLFETAKKFNLPLKREMVAAFSKYTKSKKIETHLYSLTITPDLHEVGISWTLHREELERRLTKHSVMKKPPEWGFFGFIKERPFLASDLESLKDVRDHADISTKSDGKLAFDLKEGVAYSALFVVVFDSSDAFVLDEDVTTMIQRPKTPTLDDIITLKKQLNALIHRTQTTDSMSTGDLVKAQLISVAINRAELAKATQELGYDETATSKVLDNYDEMIDRELFKMS